MNTELFLMENQWLLWFLFIWVLPWKGVALWKAAQNRHKKWFVALFLVNTASILEIAYLFYFSQKNYFSHKKKEDHAIKSVSNE